MTDPENPRKRRRITTPSEHLQDLLDKLKTARAETRNSICQPDPTITPTPQSTPDSEHVRRFRLELVQLINCCGSNALEKRLLRRRESTRGLRAKTAIKKHFDDNRHYCFGGYRSRRRFLYSPPPTSVPTQTPIQRSNDSDLQQLFNEYGMTPSSGWGGTQLLWHASLETDLSGISFPLLRKIYRKFCSKKPWRFGKSILNQELTRYFYKGTMETSRRDEEIKVLQEVDVQNLFFPLCGGKFTLSKDLMEEILSYLPRNRNLLQSVGLVCYDWYVLVLSTWRSIRIRWGRLFQIPNVVLASVRVVSIPRELSIKAVKYVAQNLSLSVERVALESGSPAETERIIRNLGALSNLRSFRVRMSLPGRKIPERYWRLRLRDVSSNLESVSGITAMCWCEGMMNLRVLRMVVSEGSSRFADVEFPLLEHLSLVFSDENRTPFDNYFSGSAEMKKVVESGEFENRVAEWILKLLSTSLRSLELGLNRHLGPLFRERLSGHFSSLLGFALNSVSDEDLNEILNCQVVSLAGQFNPALLQTMSSLRVVRLFVRLDQLPTVFSVCGELLLEDRVCEMVLRLAKATWSFRQSVQADENVLKSSSGFYWSGPLLLRFSRAKRLAVVGREAGFGLVRAVLSVLPVISEWKILFQVNVKEIHEAEHHPILKKWMENGDSQVPPVKVERGDIYDDVTFRVNHPPLAELCDDQFRGNFQFLLDDKALEYIDTRR